MASTRRIGAEGSETRAALLDAAERLMLEQGYAAVTSRRVAGAAGLKPQLVHYYFRTMDDLFLALLQRGAEQGLARLEAVVEAPQPLRALWAFSREPAGSALTVEMTALANHRKAIRSEIARYAEQFRARQVEIVTALLADRETELDGVDPVALLVIMTGISHVLGMERALGESIGHPETEALDERWLTRLDGPPPAGNVT
jgi:AcrR family transcriptional regulator